MQTPGKEQVLQHPNSGHPSLPTHSRELPAELGSCCSLTAPWASSPSFPLPGSCRGRGCGAAVRAGGHGCGASPAPGKRELGDHQAAAGGWRARPLLSLPGGAGTKARLRCHSCSPCSATAAAGRAAPRKNQPLVSPMWSPRGADTPRLRSRCDTAHVKWHRRPALPEPPPAPRGNSRTGLGCRETATSSCHHHHLQTRGKNVRG